MNSILRPTRGIRISSLSTSTLSSKCHHSNPYCRGRGSYQRRYQTPAFRAAERKLFKISEEVREATRSEKPVVALETTIYTHGYSYPDNVKLALDLEDIVRLNGGVPATIGILDGVARVGLSKEELTAIASAAGKPGTMKVSRRDLPYILGMVSGSFCAILFTLIHYILLSKTDNKLTAIRGSLDAKLLEVLQLLVP